MAETKSRKKLMSGSNPFLKNNELGPQSLLRAFFLCWVMWCEWGGGGWHEQDKKGERAAGAWKVDYYVEQCCVKRIDLLERNGHQSAYLCRIGCYCRANGHMFRYLG